ncbi:hypothetical protein NLU13_8242 [Sarocladium strictum]|uniref:DUF7702 domain-containing protein n=1 Tax=Sarocladium strictum TaxID=5046 RepID=A0AA39L4S8_SARSR|nr:hypothetical protein NLU13_8242 [Sarocladium strictum]
MVFRSVDIVALVELGFYVPALLAAFIVCSRHGFSRSSGWYYTFTLCLIRAIGAVCQLVTIAKPDSLGLIKTVLVLNHIGLTPLLLATLGMLSRLVDWINFKLDPPLLTVKHFRLAQLFVLLGAVFGIIGISQATSTSSVSTWSRVAVLCYAATYLLLVFFFVRSASYVSYLPDSEHLLTPVITMALPLVLARLVYQLLLVFVNRGPFSRNDRHVAPSIAMSVAEEMLVVLMFLALGLKLRKLSEAEQGPILMRPWKDRTKRRGRRRDGGMQGDDGLTYR